MDISKKMSFGNDIYQQIMQQLSVVDSFKGKWQFIELQQGKHLKELRKIATVESIGSSTRIEGAVLTDSEIEKLLKSVKITQLKTRDEEEIFGYYEALQTIQDNYDTIRLTESYLHQLHGILLKYSSKDNRHKGAYKSLPNKVVANYPDGTQRTIFKTTDPHLTPMEMHDLIEWTQQRFTAKDMHPILVIAMFVYEFLSIHPYQDGNGRLSRLLTALLMMQQGYFFIQYVSFENIIESRKSDYYRTLMAGQKNRGTATENPDQWILFFLACIQTLTERLETKYATYSRLETGLNERQQAILRFIKKAKRAQLKNISEALPAHSRNTLKKDIALLVQEGLLLKTGAGRGVAYHPA